MSPPSSGRRKRVLGKKPGAHPTLVQSGQTVASSWAISSAGPPGNQRDAPKTLDGFMLLDRCRDESSEALGPPLKILTALCCSAV